MTIEHWFPLRETWEALLILLSGFLISLFGWTGFLKGRFRWDWTGLIITAIGLSIVSLGWTVLLISISDRIENEPLYGMLQ